VFSQLSLHTSSQKGRLSDAAAPVVLSPFKEVNTKKERTMKNDFNILFINLGLKSYTYSFRFSAIAPPSGSGF